MFDMALSALDQIFDPTRMMFLVLGTLMGLVVGAIPGVGGLVGLTLLLPFTFTMDPYSAIAVMMGLLAVTTTSDTIPAVLFGVPGTVGSAASILDGYPLARNGQAGRALGAGFAASMLGGLIGACLLAFSMPVLKPLVLAVGSPELLAVCVFGLSLVAVLSGGAVLKGLGAACIGLLVATTGDDPQTSQLRWTFGTLYLYDGLPIVPLALGMFAIPELADLAISRKTADCAVRHRALCRVLRDVCIRAFAACEASCTRTPVRVDWYARIDRRVSARRTVEAWAACTLVDVEHAVTIPCEPVAIRVARSSVRKASDAVAPVLVESDRASGC